MEKKLSVSCTNALECVELLKTVYFQPSSQIIIFLDYDGTLTPIVSNPDLAICSDKMLNVLQQLHQNFITGIISGRSIQKLQKFVPISGLYYAGSHGFDILLPSSITNTHVKNERQQSSTNIHRHEIAKDFLPLLQQIKHNLIQKTQDIVGAMIEDNIYSISLHYRNVTTEEDIHYLQDLLTQELKNFPSLKQNNGKKVYEIKPNVEWDKGKAILYLLQTILSNQALPPTYHQNTLDFLTSLQNTPQKRPKSHSDGEKAHEEIDHGNITALKNHHVSHLPCVIYIGDDTTDEDAFDVIHHIPNSVGILVTENSMTSKASYTLRNPDQVYDFLCQLLQLNKK